MFSIMFMCINDNYSFLQVSVKMVRSNWKKMELLYYIGKENGLPFAGIILRMTTMGQQHFVISLDIDQVLRSG